MAHGFGGLGPWMWIFWILLAVVIAWVLVRAARRGGSAGAPQGGLASDGEPETPEEVLRRRYAAGEIGEEEFQRRRRQLAEDGEPSSDRPQQTREQA